MPDSSPMSQGQYLKSSWSVGRNNNTNTLLLIRTERHQKEPSETPVNQAGIVILKRQIRKQAGKVTVMRSQ